MSWVETCMFFRECFPEPFYVAYALARYRDADGNRKFVLTTNSDGELTEIFFGSLVFVDGDEVVCAF